MLKRLALGLCALFLLSTPSLAQGISQKVGVCDPKFQDRCIKPNADGSVNVSGGGGSASAFTPTGQATLSATTTSSRVALGSTDVTAVVANNGLTTAFVAFGSNTVVATTTGSYPILAGQTVAFNTGGATNIAGITASGTDALTIATGTGVPVISGAGSGGASLTAQAASTNPTLSAGTASLYEDLGGRQWVRDDTLATLVAGATPAGTNIIGKFGIDQTTPGTTNAVSLQIGSAAPSLTNPIWTANAEAADVTGTFTNATQTTSITNSAADGYANGLLSINGTYATASGVFEASDDGGTTWYSIACVRSDGSVSETGYTSLTNVSRQWSCTVGGNDSVRIRSTAVASGTVNARVGVSAPPSSQGVTLTNSALPILSATDTANLAGIFNGVGTSGSGITQPTGGAGELGWLSGLYNVAQQPIPLSGVSVTESAVTANKASGTTGTGLLGVGNMVFDGTNWQKSAGDTAGGQSIVEIARTTSNLVPVASSGVSTLQGKSSAGVLYTAYMTNTDTVPHHFCAINTTTTPTSTTFTFGIASGNVQDDIIVAAGQTGSLGGLPIGEPFSVGIYFTNSTTACSSVTLSTIGIMHGNVK